jgi:hypothetical protein
MAELALDVAVDGGSRSADPSIRLRIEPPRGDLAALRR